MNINTYLLLGLVFSLLVTIYLIGKLHRVRQQLSFISDALEDLKGGNLNRRVLAQENDMTKQICYGINEIATNSQIQLIQQRQAEQAYKRLMTSLSHDVKTPLASLVGYLEAIENGLVTGAEKDEYTHVAFEKATKLKDFVATLFEWVKLDAGEQIYHFDVIEINELSRNIIAEWIPIFESAGMEYHIDIAEDDCFVRADSNAYTRIMNNLLQNVVIHSNATHLTLCISNDEQRIKISVADNGNGISPDELPHIFERMYQCDRSRSAQGNGLGLSIAKELVNAHKGTITATSVPGTETTFTVLLPKAL